MVRFALYLVLSIQLSLSIATNTNKSACVVRENIIEDGYLLDCTRLDRFGHTLPLEAEIDSEPPPQLHLSTDYRGPKYNFSDVIDNITTIRTHYPDLHLNIGSGTFARFPNLSMLELIGSTIRDLGEIRSRLTVSANGFRDVPKLRSIYVAGHVLSESTVEALGTLKDQVRELYLKSTSPEAEILSQIGKFGKLEVMSLLDICGKNQLPNDIFKRSAGTLRKIVLDKCDMPTIGKDFFGSMPNLVYLKWTHSNITAIEPGAFDAMPKLETLMVRNNDLETLPDGLFNNNKKLKLVDFDDTLMTGLTRENFTHAENFGAFSLET